MDTTVLALNSGIDTVERQGGILPCRSTFEQEEYDAGKEKITFALTALSVGAAVMVPPQAFAQQETFLVRVENIAKEPLNTSKGPAPFTLSPGVWTVHTGVNPMFKPFERLQGMRGKGLANLAEDGKPLDPLVKGLEGQSGVKAVGIFNTPESKTEKGWLKPKMMYEFTAPANPGDQLTLATLFAESSDLFYASYGRSIPPLFRWQAD
jgi:hypothetical protein